VAQQLVIADYVNNVNDNRRAGTKQFQQHRSTVTNQLRVLETLVPRLGTEEEKLKHAEAKLLQLNDRLANMSQMLSHTREQIRSLSSEVQNGNRNLAVETRSIDEVREWDNLYAAFEDQFRGSAEEVEERLKFYLPFLKELTPDSKILDLGSGRGDWLKLVSKEGFKPSGVEINEVFAEGSGKQGLEVVHGDMMAHLDQQPDNSLDLITVFHLIEHLNSEKLFRLLDEIKRTLKPGGRVFMETPSSENLVVAACNFYADPTHHKPVNPHTLMFVLRQKGFIDLGLQFLHPVEGSPFKECEGAEQLNMWFYGPRDVAVTARKAQ
jgi:O-antigen chain-terminating methyltransferase